MNNVALTTNYRDWIEENIPGIKWTGPQGHGKCPLHPDHNPSFAINAEHGVWKCHAGCGEGSIRKLAEKMGAVTPNSVFFQEDSSVRNGGLCKTWDHDKEYTYTDEHGTPLLLVGRDRTGSGKTFRQYHFAEEVNDWVIGRGGVTPVPYTLPAVLKAKKAGETIFVVEGEKDADTLHQQGLTATTNMSGAGNWPSDDAFNVFFRGADVVILPDNDKPGKQHANKVASCLQVYAERVRILELPGLDVKGDVTDWLEAGNTVEKLKELVEMALVWQAAVNEVNPQMVTPKISINVLERFFDGGRFSPPLLAEEILRNHHFFNDGKTLFVYQHGVYTPNGIMEVRKIASEFLGVHSNKNRVEEVIYHIQTVTSLSKQELNVDDGLINVQNGLVNWRTGELIPHSPERLSTIQLPVRYDPDDSCPQFETFLAQVLPHDALPTVLEFIGYCLVPNTKYEKAMMFTGTGANGKSVLINVMQTLVGRDNSTGIPLQELSDNRFKRAELQNKLLNLFADLSGKALETSHLFKTIVSGDTIDAERKGKHPFFFKPFAKLLFSANEIPGGKDVSAAFFRRLMIVPFPNQFEYGKNADPNLLEKLTTQQELSGLLNIALKGLHRLEQQGEFTQCESVNDALKQYKNEVDSVLSFVQESCELAVDVSCPTKILFQAYKQWCEDSGIKGLGRSTFYKRLQEHFPWLKKHRDNAAPEYWRGIALITF